MDPATIIGTTSAILSFVDFTGKVISTAIEIRNSVHTTTEDNRDFEEAIQDFHQNLQELRASIGKSAGLPGPQDTTGHDPGTRLLKAAGKCERLGVKISTLLEKTKAKAPSMDSTRTKYGRLFSRKSTSKPTGRAAPANKPTMIEAIRASVQTIWKKEDFEVLRREWGMCILEFNIAQSRFEDGQRSRMFQDAQSKQLDEIRRLTDALLPESEKRKLGDLWSVLDDLKASDSEASRENQNVQWIRKALEFRGMGDRKHRVEEAASDTFQWCISKGEIPENHPNLEKSLKTWLDDGSGVFHITGKPGSGKSTLMKLIDNSEDTETQLQKWASRSHKHLVRASFYTWKAAEANRLQNQSEGLMRTLLHQILDQVPEFTKEVFPNYWYPERFSRAKRWSQSSPPDLQQKLVVDAREIRQALDSIIKSEKDIQLFLLIDGMDEFANEGEHWDLVKIVRSWTVKNNLEGQATSCKICVSSREERAFMQGFSDSQRLRLHVVTEADVRTLATTRLRENDTFLLASQDDQRRLIGCLVEHTQGVFLWVCLMIEELKLQLNEQESFESLFDSIKACPQDLNDFFRETLGRIHHRYRAEAAAIFTVALALNNNHLLQSRFNLFYYSMIGNCLTEGYVSPQHHSQVKTPQEVVTRIDDFVLRLPSLCKGLLQANVGCDLSVEIPFETRLWLRGGQLSFIHRSVHDFFCDQQEILARMTPKGFQAMDLILRALIRSLEVSSWDLAHNAQYALVSEFALQALDSKLAKIEESSAFWYLRMLEAVLLRKQQVISEVGKFDESLALRDMHQLPGTDFVVLRVAVRIGYTPYIRWATVNYPPWLFSEAGQAWFFQRLIRDIDKSHYLHSVKRLIQTSWFSMNKRLSVAHSLIPGFLPPLSGSLWLNTLIFILLESEYKGYVHYVRWKDWTKVLCEFFDLGAEPRIEFRWWSEPPPPAHPHREQSAVMEGTHLQVPGPDTSWQQERHDRTFSPYSSWHRLAEPMSLGSSFGVTVTVGDDPGSQHHIQGPQWQTNERDTHLIATFITSFKKASGKAALRDVLELFFTANPDRVWHKSEHREYVTEILDSGRMEILRALDGALDRLQGQPSVKELVGAEQDEVQIAAVAIPDQERNNQVNTHAKNTSINSGCLKSPHDLLGRYQITLLMCLGLLLAAVVGSFWGALIWES